MNEDSGSQMIGDVTLELTDSIHSIVGAVDETTVCKLHSGSSDCCEWVYLGKSNRFPLVTVTRFCQ